MRRPAAVDRLLTFFGLELRRKQVGTLAPVDGRGWFPIIRESFAGAWQRGIEVRREEVLAYSTVFACMTLIAGDIAKLWLNLVAEDDNQISTPNNTSPYAAVLRKPNHYQNRIQFFLCWVLAKLIHGNSYILKRRDKRGIVTDLYVLDAFRVKPLVAPDGAVFYQLHVDYLSGLEEQSELVVPAQEIIHDLMYPLFHPLVGLSPIVACGLAATQGLKIQTHSAAFFANNAMLSGLLVAPGTISRDTADRLEKHWETHYAGESNAGKIAVIGDGLKFEPAPIVRAIDAQLIDQLKWSGENVCSCFHVPPYMVGLGALPSYNNVQALNQQYYSQALQLLIESIELCLNEGLELPSPYATEFDLDALLRMDTATAIESATKGVTGGVYKPNEARARLNLKPVEGGDTPYLQQQQYSLAALARRDQAQPPPPTDPLKPPPAAPDPPVKELAQAARVGLRHKLGLAA